MPLYSASVYIYTFTNNTTNNYNSTTFNIHGQGDYTDNNTHMYVASYVHCTICIRSSVHLFLCN